MREELASIIQRLRSQRDRLIAATEVANFDHASKEGRADIELLTTTEAALVNAVLAAGLTPGHRELASRLDSLVSATECVESRCGDVETAVESVKASIDYAALTRE